jgi:hypothetical protein
MCQDSHHIDLEDPPTCTSSSFLNYLHIISMDLISSLIRWSSAPKPIKSLIALTISPFLVIDDNLIRAYKRYKL